MLTQSHSLLLGIKPFYVDWPSRSWNDSIFQFFNSIFRITQRCEFHKWWSCEPIVFSNEFDIEYFAVLFKEFPYIVFFPTDGEISRIDDQLYLFGGQLLLSGKGRFRPFASFSTSFFVFILFIDFLGLFLFLWNGGCLHLIFNYKWISVKIVIKLFIAAIQVNFYTRDTTQQIIF